MTKYLFFENSGKQFAIEARFTVKPVSITPIPMPGAKKEVLGVWPFQKNLLTVLDFGTLIGEAQTKSQGVYMLLSYPVPLIWKIDNPLYIKEYDHSESSLTEEKLIVDPSHYFSPKPSSPSSDPFSVHVCFRLGPVWFAVDIKHVIEIRDMKDYPLQRTEGISFVEGLLRTQESAPIPLLNLSRLLSFPEKEGRILILSSLHCNKLFALSVPCELEILSKYEIVWEISKELSRFPNPFCKALILSNKRPVWMLDSQALFPSKLVNIMDQKLRDLALVLTVYTVG